MYLLLGLLNVYPAALRSKPGASILPGTAVEAEQVPLEPVRRNRPTGDTAGLFGAVDVEPGGTPLCSQEPAQRHVDQLAAAQWRSAGVSVERHKDVIVDGDSDATGHAEIVRAPGPGASPAVSSGESTSPVGTLG